MGCLSTQESIKSDFYWSDLWQLIFNIKKCLAFNIGKNNTQFTFTVKGVPIHNENTITDIGIIFSKDLTSHDHINNTVAKFHQRLCYNTQILELQ